MSKHIESRNESSSRDREGGQSREVSSRSTSREVPSRATSTRVVSAVGAVLKRPHSQVSVQDENYYKLLFGAYRYIYKLYLSG